MLHIDSFPKLTLVFIYLTPSLRIIIFNKGEDIFISTFFIGFFPDLGMSYLEIGA